MPTGELVDWICQPQELHDQGKSLQTLPSVHLGEAGNLPSKYIGISKTELLIDGVNAGEPENVRFPLRKDGRMSTFILPLESLGSSFNGKVYSLEVK